MDDVGDLLKGGGGDLMSKSHPGADGRHQMSSPTGGDSWRWTEYQSKYRPFSQYSYSSGSWHRTQPLDCTDGPSSWYAEVAERIHKAEEYKARSLSSGIGNTDYPSERNRLIWSNSVAALSSQQADSADGGGAIASAGGHRRQKSRFHSLGPTFPPVKDNSVLPVTGKPLSAGSRAPPAVPATGSSGQTRTSRSVSRRRPEKRQPAQQPTSPGKLLAGSTTRSTTPRTPSSVKKEVDSAKDATKVSKPRAVVKPTPAKQGNKVVKEDKVAKEDKKWIRPSTTNEAIEKDKPSPLIQKEGQDPKTSESRTLAAQNQICNASQPSPTNIVSKGEEKPENDLSKRHSLESVKHIDSDNRLQPTSSHSVTQANECNPNASPSVERDTTNTAQGSTSYTEKNRESSVLTVESTPTTITAPLENAQDRPSANLEEKVTIPTTATTTSTATTAAHDQKEQMQTPPTLTGSSHPENFGSVTTPSGDPTASPLNSESTITSVPPAIVPTSVVKSIPTVCDPMTQSFIDANTIGSVGVATNAKTVPKPGDYSMARSRLDEFWAEGK